MTGRLAETPLRRRIALLLGAIGAGAILVLLALAAFGQRAAGEEARHSLVAWSTGGVLLVLVLLVVCWRMLDREIFEALDHLSRDLKLAVQMHGDGPVRALHGRAAAPEMRALVATLSDELERARQAAAAAVTESAERVEAQKSQLEAILLDLTEGMIVCNAAHQILLYNQEAVRLLSPDGRIGLGRSVLELLASPSIVHAFELLVHRLEETGADGEDARLRAPLVCSTSDGRALFKGRVAIVVGHDRSAAGYVLTIQEATEEIAALVRRDALLHRAIEGLRGPLASIRAASETLAENLDMALKDRQKFQAAVLAESRLASDRIEELATDYRDMASGRAWPIYDMYSADLLTIVARRLKGRAQIDATVVGLPQWLAGDGSLLAMAIETLAVLLRDEVGVRSIDLEATAAKRYVSIDIAWAGEPAMPATIARWLDQPLLGGAGALLLRDAIAAHRSELWSSVTRPGHSVLRMPVPRGTLADAGRHRSKSPPRSEYYDFALFEALPDSYAEMPLRAATYIVFDTETTGLDTTGRDAIVSIAGVRIVNGRVLMGETFERLVNPGRPIPKDSTRVHGIVDSMVAEKPPIEVVLPHFKVFVGNSVLIAHNAAFDMAFLKHHQAECGVTFDENPVLDTLLLSALLFDHYADHSLDAIAERLGIEIGGRHTALGDAMATAAIFVRFLDILPSRGVATVADALASSARIARVRARQMAG